MGSDFEIGRVVAVDTSQVTVLLAADLRALTRTTYEGAFEVGRINSYVIIPVGVRRLVAMVTRVVLTEEAELRPEKTMVALPTARRVMKATLIGTLEGARFTQGVSAFPVLDTPVLLASKADLDRIFEGTTAEASGSEENPPGFCVPIGESAIFEGYPIHIDPDAFFGKHAAIIGSTGSGKSCTIASLLQSVLADPKIKRTNFVILDTNGEYRSAFQRYSDEGSWSGVHNRNVLYIPSDRTKTADRLSVPYWFMNADDFVRLFQASRGVQRPVLLEALRLARNASVPRAVPEQVREQLITEFGRIWSLSGKDEKTSKDVRDLADGVKKWLSNGYPDEIWNELPITKKQVLDAVEKVSTVAKGHIDGVYPKTIPADGRQAIREAIDPLYTALTGATLGGSTSTIGVSADAPVHFHKGRFRTRHIEQVLRREESGGARARDFSGTMLLRIDRLLADGRFEFLFGPVGGELPNPTHALAAFLRDVLGLRYRENPEPELSDEGAVPEDTLPFYDRQRNQAPDRHVVIVDLSLLAAEVLENVTALIGRLILEFLQRLGETGEEDLRGSLPVVLVLEEAQNYVGTKRADDDESISRAVFERIAREGRKYGLSLVVASQRPSELSRTVLSQCSSFVVHRLQNPEDLRYFKDIVPGIYGPLLDQLPALAAQTAFVLGECVRAPTLVRIRDADPLPRSRDPRFYRHWVREAESVVPVEEVCQRWAGEVPSVEGNGAGKAPAAGG